MFTRDLPVTEANYVPLSPISFLPRAAALFSENLAWIDSGDSCNWRDFFTSCRKLASALENSGIGPGDTVSALLHNTPEMLEAHFGVPATGAVLNAINTRLDVEAIAFILGHAETKLLLVDLDLLSNTKAAVELLDGQKPKIVVVGGQQAGPYEFIDYCEFVSIGDPNWAWRVPSDEWDALSLNYTSGTSGNPKGVVVHHRGAYLNAISNTLTSQMSDETVYLWTLPLFHCNGWCFPWTLALVGATSVCLRKVEPATVFKMIIDHGVTHMCGAPIVYNMLLNFEREATESLPQRVTGFLGGASPPASVIAGCEALGIDVVHVYGLTEVYGPSAMCLPRSDWSQLPADSRAKMLARQGVASPLQESMAVMDPITMRPVPHDGESIGEVFFRGNVVMKGYLKNPCATEAALEGGWFHTGDLAVTEPDGYIKVVDRSKDVIISGGENISSLEVEEVLYRHHSVLHAAVVAKPDDKWGEVPCAFVELKSGAVKNGSELIAHCRERIAHYKCPREVVFCELPKTSTGKIQKFKLRGHFSEI
ncbi:MAG: AMP-binding protein [Pseudomonadota bacterium]